MRTFMNGKYCLIFTFAFVSSFYAHAERIHCFYGDMFIDEPVLLKLIKCPSMQRLKDIHQYGISYYLDPSLQPYSRYDHSIGVLYFVRTLGGSLHEQIAALLHDVSHTAFSHVAEHLFANTRSTRSYTEGINSYQDDIHLWFLQQTEIPEILAEYSIALEDIHHKKNSFLMLEQPLPNLCADRLEYNLYGGYIAGILTKDEIKEIVQQLAFKDDTWVMLSSEAARNLAATSLYLTEYVFGSARNFYEYHYGAELLKIALENSIISARDLHFSSDCPILRTLTTASNIHIQTLLKKLLSPNEYKATSSDNIYVKNKFRGVNPWIKTDKMLMRLTDLDDDFCKQFHKTKEKMEQGFYITV